jgi:hypothetical protein
MLQSLYNKVITKAYDNAQGIKQEIRNGIVQVSQKKKVVGLELVAGFKDQNGNAYPAGSKAYVLEDNLMSQPWAKDRRHCDAFAGEFIIVDINQVVFFETKKEI